jgi:outer membrane biosynthesis protein TonB
MKTSLTISSAAHAGLLLWGLVSFAAKPFDAMPTDSLPVDIISADQFSQLTKGQKNAPKVETQKPLVEKIADTKPIENLAKVSDKKEIVTASAEPPPAPPSKPEPQKSESKKEPEPKVDAIAEALKKEKEETKKPPKPDPKSAPAPKPVQQQPKFDPRQVAALLDKRDPQRQAAAGEIPYTTPSLGVSTGSATRISQSELAALRARLAHLWSPPSGVTNPEDLIVRVRFQLTRDRRLAGPIAILTRRPGILFAAVQESVARAIVLGQPYDMLRPETYEEWRDLEVTFDPREMFPG